jgi:hypothetical protein
MASVDPVAVIFNDLLAVLAGDADFPGLIAAANVHPDTQIGWQATFLSSAAAQYPQFRFLLGNGKDYGMLKDESFSAETNAQLPEWLGRLDQDFMFEFTYDVNMHDSMKQRVYEFAAQRALLRLGPRAGIPYIYLPVGPFVTRRGSSVDASNVTRPITRIMFNVSAEYHGSTIL